MTIHGTIFISNDAANVANDPANLVDIVATYVEDALSHVGINHWIQRSNDYSFDPEPQCAENPDIGQGATYPNIEHDTAMGCVLDKFSSWVDGRQDESLDFNLMLMADYWSGQRGLAGVSSEVQNANTAVVKGAEIIEDEHDSSFPRYYGSNDILKAAIHEIGHNLSLSHGSGGFQDNGSNPDGGATFFMYTGGWISIPIHGLTPHAPSSDEIPADNECGENINPPGFLFNDFYFYDGCAEDFIEEYEEVH